MNVLYIIFRQVTGRQYMTLLDIPVDFIRF